MIKVLVVDLGGVVAHFHPERRMQALAALGGISPEIIQARLFDSGFEREAELGMHSSDQVVAIVRHLLGAGVSNTAAIEAWALAFEPNMKILERIMSLPVRRALFTNNGPMIDACLAGPLQSIGAAFSEIICSWHIKARKPDAIAFEKAAARLGCQPAELLLLDDNIENVESARNCGWHAERVTGLDDLDIALSCYPELRHRD